MILKRYLYLTLILISPAIQFFQYNFWTDVILIGLFIFALIGIEKNKIIISSFILCIAMLIHELSILLFAPILGSFVLYKSYYKNNKDIIKSIKDTIIFSILPLITIFLILTIGYEAKPEVMEQYGDTIIGARIYSYSLQSEFLSTEQITFTYGAIFKLIQVLILSAAYILFIKDNKLDKTLFVIAPFTAIFILLFAYDWGRFLALMEFNILITMLYLPMIKNISFEKLEKYKYYYLFITLLAPINLSL